MSALPSRSEIDAERARRSLGLFVGQAWPEIEPASPFMGGWHVDAICGSLEALARGEIRRLIINVPPRHAKSTIASVAFPAWMWLSAPQTRFLFASYAIDLALRDSVRTRRLVESAWYRDMWRTRWQLTVDQNAKARFANTRGGVRFSTSVGGGATGEGGDIIIIDDPHKLEHAASAASREGTIEWFDGVISTRLNDPRTGGIVIIAQRVHEHDLCGHLLEQGGWHHLCLPAEFDPTHPFLWPDDPRTEAGELLWPERFGPGEIADLKLRLGSYAAAAQLQQLPAPAGGGILQRAWWRYYDPAGPLPVFDEILQSWDLTFSGNPTSDYVVGQLWGLHGADMYLLRQTRAQLGFVDTVNAIRELTRGANRRFPAWSGHAILIEQSANGAPAIDVLRLEIPAIIPVHPVGDKVSRAHAISATVEAGNVHLPGAMNTAGTGYDRTRTPEWVQAFVEEAAVFPNGAYDDQVDAMTQALQRAYRPEPNVRLLSSGGRPPTRRLGRW